MNSRERILAIITGGILAIMAIGFVYMRIAAAFTFQTNAIAKLKEDISKKERNLRTARKAEKRLNVYREMSLPEDLELAESLYEAWLFESIDSVGMSKPQVASTTEQTKEKGIHKLTFTIASQGNLEQFTRLLHQLYSSDHLHRVRSIRLQPTKDSKELSTSITIDALALSKSDNVDSLNAQASDRLHHSEEEYREAIVGRNLFTLANKAPRFTSSSTQRGVPNSMLSFDVKATDSDPLDQVTYAFEGDPPAGAKLDPKSGKFSWTPKEKGEFEMTVIAKDNGLPARSERQVVKLVVSDPPPPPEKPKKKLEFDDAKHTYLTGITAVDGRAEAWFTIRTTDRILKLHVGEKVEVGSIQGTIKQINDSSVELEADGKTLMMTLGDALLSKGVIATSDS